MSAFSAYTRKRSRSASYNRTASPAPRPMMNKIRNSLKVMKKAEGDNSYKGTSQIIKSNHYKDDDVSLQTNLNQCLTSLFPTIRWDRVGFNSAQLKSTAGYQGVHEYGSGSGDGSFQAKVGQWWTQAELLDITKKIYTDYSPIDDVTNDAVSTNVNAVDAAWSTHYTGVQCLGGHRTYRLINTSSVITSGVFYVLANKIPLQNMNGGPSPYWNDDLISNYDVITDTVAPIATDNQMFQKQIFFLGARPDEAKNKNFNRMFRVVEKHYYRLQPGEHTHIRVKIEKVTITQDDLKYTIAPGNDSTPTMADIIPKLTKNILNIAWGQNAYDDTSTTDCVNGPGPITLEISVSETVRWRGCFRAKNYFHFTTPLDFTAAYDSVSVRTATYPALAAPKILNNEGEQPVEFGFTDYD